MAVSERLQLTAPPAQGAAVPVEDVNSGSDGPVADEDNAGSLGMSAMGTDRTGEGTDDPAQLAHWPRWAIPLCLAVYAVLAVLAFLPGSPFSTTTVPTVPNTNPSWQDPFQMMWFLAYLPYALTHGGSFFHTTLINYPGGVNLADNTWVPVLSILGWPITATLGPVAAFNFLLRLAFLSSAGSMFLVMRRWCSSWQGPFVAGLLYAFSPYMTAQELHLDLVFVPIPPLLLLLGDELVRRQRMRPLALGSLIGSAVVLQYLLSPDVLSGCGVIALLIGGVLAVRFRSQLRKRIGYIWRATATALGVFVAVAGYPIYEMLAGPVHLVGPLLTVRRLQFNSADLLGVITPTSHQRVAPSLLSQFGDAMDHGNLSENGAYLGIPFIIVLVLLVRRLRKDALVAIAALGAILAFILSLGAHLVVAHWRSPIPMPGWVLSVMPVLNDTIPARYALYVWVFVAAIVAVAIDRLWSPLWARGWTARPPATPGLRRLGSFVAGPRARLGLAAGAVAATLLPNIPFAIAGTPWPASLPAALQQLLPKGGEVATIPEASPQDAAPMAWQAIDRMSFSIIGGYANVQGRGVAYGQKWPFPGEPRFLLGESTQPEIAFGFFTPPRATPTAAYAHSELCQYIAKNQLVALVYTYPQSTPLSPTDPTATALSLATQGLGRPTLFAPGYSIWLTAGRCSNSPNSS